MLKIIETFDSLPMNFYVQSDLYFNPGNIASLQVINNKIHTNISDGLHPIGIIDDINSKYIREIHYGNYLIPEFHVDSSCKLLKDTKYKLPHTNIIKNSFKANVVGEINLKQGVFCIAKDTVIDTIGLTVSKPDCISKNLTMFKYSYAYNIESKYTSSILGSNRCVVWVNPIIGETNMYDTSMSYHKHDKLYVVNGMLTSMVNEWSKPVGVALNTPDNVNPNLKFLWDMDGKIDASNY